MATVTVTHQIEATPDVIKQVLTQNLGPFKEKGFPYPEGSYVNLNEVSENAVQAVPEMPVLIVAASSTHDMALMAYVMQNGVVGFARVTSVQLRLA